MYNSVRQKDGQVPVYEVVPKLLHRNMLLPCTYLPVTQPGRKKRRCRNLAANGENDAENNDDIPGFVPQQINKINEDLNPDSNFNEDLIQKNLALCQKRTNMRQNQKHRTILLA